MVDSNNATNGAGIGCLGNSTAVLDSVHLLSNYARKDGAGIMLGDTAQV
jgi:hypothetical protein